MRMDNNAASRGKNNDQRCAAGRSTAPFLFAVIAGLSILILRGCGQRARRVFRGKQRPQPTRISKEGPREELDAFQEYAAARFKQVAGELDVLVPGLKTRKINLIMRTRLGQAFRAMLQTAHQLPFLNTQRGVKINPDGTTDIYFGPSAPAGKESSWIQTVPGKGWNVILRFYGPLESWFDQTWRPGEI
jgi:hypothetical protein